MRGVKYYSPDDLSCGYNLKKSEEVLLEIRKNEIDFNINQILELYNIYCYFENNIFLKEWSENEREQYRNIVKDFIGVIGKYFAQIDENNCVMIFTNVDIEYLEDFWFLFGKLNTFKNVSKNKMEQIMRQKKFHLCNILRNKHLVEYYGQEIRNYMFFEKSSAELLLDEYAVSNMEKGYKYFFPSELNMDDKEKIILNYIESFDANPNYLEIISQFQSNGNLKLTNKTKLKAKKTYNNWEEKVFSKDTGFSFDVQVTFDKTQNEEKIVETKSNLIYVSYSSLWIKENLDYATLLNNFIYLFEFVDMQGRFTHVNKKNQMGVFEQIMGLRGRREYIKGVAFEQINGLALLQIEAYYDVLKKMGIRLEHILEWFFKEYLNDEFEIVGFYVNLPSEQSSYLEKCRMIVAEIDSVLKQFRMYVEDKKIDYELLQLSSEHMFIKDIPSLLKSKYIYGIGEQYQYVCYHMFSNQSMICYIEKFRDKYSTFYELLKNKDVKITDFEEYNKPDIENLLQMGYLYEDEQRYFRYNIEIIKILYQLYHNEVLNRYYIKEYDSFIKELENHDMLAYKSTLFSKPEEDYLNYILNKSEFTNGLDLRNKYVHGTQSMNVEVQKTEYYTLLRILVLIVIKINEEFCLYEEVDKL